MKKINIDTDFITLSQFLKMENFVSSGGEVRYFLQDNDVYINAELEKRRGKKLYPQDKIKIADKTFLIADEN